jgi:hypothetical protein
MHPVRRVPGSGPRSRLRERRAARIQPKWGRSPGGISPPFGDMSRHGTQPLKPLRPPDEDLGGLYPWSKR